MPRNYSIDGSDTNTAGTSILGLTSAATIRPKIYSIILGPAGGTPADNAADYYLQRYTAAGTATAVTPQAIDPADPASLASAGEAHSAEPTYTANAIMLRISKHQRGAWKWEAGDGREIVLPATAANGVGLQSQTISGAYAESCVMHYAE